MAGYGNSIGANSAGIPTFDANGLVTTSTVTQYGAVYGGASNALASTAALSKGQSIWGTTGGAPTVIAAGADGTVPIYASGQTGGMLPGIPAGTWKVLGSSLNFSGSSNIDFTSGITTAYSLFAITWINLTMGTNGGVLWLRTSTDGGSTYDAGTSYATGSSGQAQIPLTSGFSNASNCGGSGIVYCFGTGQSKYSSFWTCGVYNNTSTTVGQNTQMGQRQSTTAVNAIRLLPSSGTFSGSMYLYGLST